MSMTPIAEAQKLVVDRIGTVRGGLASNVYRGKQATPRTAAEYVEVWFASLGEPNRCTRAIDRTLMMGGRAVSNNEENAATLVGEIVTYMEADARTNIRGTAVTIKHIDMDAGNDDDEDEFESLQRASVTFTITAHINYPRS